MDFAKFDARGKAETGKAFPILHPETLLPLVEGDKEAKFIVRGNASPSVQAAHKAALAQAAKNKDDDEEIATFTFERLHQSTIKAAMVLLAGFENVEIEGVPVTMDNAEQFLNLVFPRMVKDTENGGWKIANKTFAMQVVERANELDALLGNV